MLGTDLEQERCLSALPKVATRNSKNGTGSLVECDFCNRR